MNFISDPFYLLPPLVAVITVVILLAVIRRLASRNFYVTIFSGVLLSMGIFTGLILGMRLSPDIHTALIWNRAAAVPAFSIWVLFYHFSLSYTGNRGQRYFLKLAYLMLFIIIPFTPTNLITTEVRLDVYGYAPVTGPVGMVMAFVGLLLMGGGIYNLLRRYNKSNSYEEKNRLLYLMIAFVFPLIGAFLDGFTKLPPAAIWGNLVFFIICTIVIVKYQLLDIRFAIRRSLAYLLASFVVAVPYVVTLVVMNRIFETRIQGWWIHALAVLVLAIVLRPLSNWAQQFVDRIFFRDQYDYLEALQRFTHETQSIVNLNELCSTLVTLVHGALRSSNIYLLLPSEEQQGFILISHIGLKDSVTGILLDNDCLLIKWLQLQGGIFTSEQLESTPNLANHSQKDMNILKSMEAELLVPLKTRYGQLSGILILGSKLSQQPYSDAEKRLLITLSNQMAIALENARLYDLEKNLRIELEKQNEQKTEFLHNVAHELKTPLTAVMSSSDLLNTEISSISPEQMVKLSGNIFRGVSSMNRKITELLELAEMERGKISLNLEPLDISSILKDISSQFSILFQESHQKFEMILSDSMPTVMGDREKVEEIIMNLLSNANKYSITGGSIVLRSKVADNYIIVEIEDTAEPIPDEQKPKLFEPYYRGENDSERSKAPGFGLGLAICKTLVELHQGKIWIENNNSIGNIFCFSLPILNNSKKDMKSEERRQSLMN